ncbi:MAG TPA: hypothetical protein VGA42_03835 [Gemmatimonadales bacterium]
MELEHAGRRYALAGGELIVGSDPGSGIVLEALYARHAVVKPLGPRMATIRPLEQGAAIEVNGVPVGQEAMPLMDGDLVRLGPHELWVRNPAHPAGGPDSPPPGARQRLHDTLFGMPRPTPTPPEGSPPADPSAPAVPRAERRWIGIAALLALLALLAVLAL